MRGFGAAFSAGDRTRKTFTRFTTPAGNRAPRVTCSLSATPDLLRQRAALLARIREFFRERSVLEVETPALSTAGISDPAIESVTANLRGRRYWLHTSPEYAMKRLLAAGIGDCYQICRVFRDGELGRWHQPEFTMLEWYRVDSDETALMDEVEEFIQCASGESVLLGPSSRLSYADAFGRTVGTDPHGDLSGLPGRLASLGISVPNDLDRDALLDLAFSEAVTARFERDALTFVYDYPASQAALAAIKPHTPPVAARFEVFAGRIELANGFPRVDRRGRTTSPVLKRDRDTPRARPAGRAARRGVSRRARKWLAALRGGGGRCRPARCIGHRARQYRRGHELRPRVIGIGQSAFRVPHARSGPSGARPIAASAWLLL